MRWCYYTGGCCEAEITCLHDVTVNFRLEGSVNETFLH